MNTLDQKINEHFQGLVVRKDLVKTVKQVRFEDHRGGGGDVSGGGSGGGNSNNATSGRGNNDCFKKAQCHICKKFGHTTRTCPDKLS